MHLDPALAVGGVYAAEVFSKVFLPHVLDAEEVVALVVDDLTHAVALARNEQFALVTPPNLGNKKHVFGLRLFLTNNVKVLR